MTGMKNSEAKRSSTQKSFLYVFRMVELRKPMGLELDEDEEGNVFVKSIEKGGRAEKTGSVFVGDYGSTKILLYAYCILFSSTRLIYLI